MKKSLINIVITLGLLMSQESFSSTRGDFKELYLGQSIDDLVIKFMEENDIPGMSLAIVQAPYITRTVGYGLANTKSRRLVSPKTLFPIGQITTAYTAIAIMQLVEGNKIKLDDPIDKYLAHLPKNWHKVTIRNLISHTSGIPSYTEVSGFEYSNSYTPQQILDFVKDKKLLFEPGNGVSKSGTNYYLLGMLIEKISGMSYPEYITEYQFKPLGLTSTFFPSQLQKGLKNEVDDNKAGFVHSKFKEEQVYIDPTELATGYTQSPNGLIETKPSQETATFAYAGIISTPYEMSVWDIGLAGNILIKNPENRAFLYNAIKLNNKEVVPANAGWLFMGHPGLMNIEGNLPGYSSLLSRFTAELICVTLLANKDNVINLDVLSHNIASAHNSKVAIPTAAPWVITRLSPYSVTETIKRFTAIIEEQGGQIFATVDHGGNAEKSGQQLNEMQVLIFGNPSKGTGLLKSTPPIGLDLPLRTMVWKDDTGQVYLAFTNPIELAKQYQASGQDELLKQMYKMLSLAARKATLTY